MRRDTQRQVAGSFRRPRSAAAAWPQLRRRRSSMIRAVRAGRLRRSRIRRTRLFRARLPAHRGARLAATDVKPDDPGMTCRPSREPRRRYGVSKPRVQAVFACAPGLGRPRAARRSSLRRCVAIPADVSSQAILPARFPAPRVLCDNTQRSAACPSSRFARLTSARIRPTRNGRAALEPFNETHAV
jgi:hypothetical protein